MTKEELFEKLKEKNESTVEYTYKPFTRDDLKKETKTMIHVVDEKTITYTFDSAEECKKYNELFKQVLNQYHPVPEDYEPTHDMAWALTMLKNGCFVTRKEFDGIYLINVPRFLPSGIQSLTCKVLPIGGKVTSDMNLDQDDLNANDWKLYKID